MSHHPPGLRALARVERRSVVASSMLLLGTSAASLGGAYFLGRALADAAHGGAWFEPLMGAVALAFGRSALSLAHAGLSARVTTRVTSEARERLVGHVLEVGPDLLRSEDAAGRVRLAIAEAAPATARYLTTYLPQLVATVAGTTLAVAALAVCAPLTAGLVLAAVVCVPVTQMLWRHSLGRRGEVYWSASARLTDRLEDAFRNLDEIVTLGAAERVQARLSAAAEDVRRTAVAALRTSMSIYAVTTALLGVATVGATVLLGWSSGGAISAAAVLVGWALVPEAARPGQAFREAWFQGHSATGAQGQVERLLAVPAPLLTVTEAPLGTLEPSRALQLELEGVSVRLGDPSNPVLALDDVSAIFSAGRVTALLGDSGSGKSTALSLLMRHRDPDVGRVLLGGRDVCDLELGSVRGAFAWVSQDVVLFAGTVAENLRLSRPEASEDEIAEAAERARLLLAPAAGGLPGGLATEVGDEGRLLSGGQRQRVAIARALLRDAPVVILDEPTSALDVDNEAAVMESLAEACRGRTVVVVSHRPDGLLPVDHTVALRGGRVLAPERVR